MARQESDQWSEYVRRVGLSVLHLQRAAVNGGAVGKELTSLLFKLDADNRTSVLVVAKATSDGQQLVAFSGAPDLATAVIGFSKKVAADTVRWREDRPWGGE